MVRAAVAQPQPVSGAHARRRLGEMKDNTVTPGVRTYRRPNDYWTLAITGTSSFIADLNAALAATGRDL